MSNWFSGNSNNDSSQSSIDKKKRSKANDSSDNDSWYSSFNGNGNGLFSRGDNSEDNNSSLDKSNKDAKNEKKDKNDDDDSKDSGFIQTSISFLVWTIVSLIITFLFIYVKKNKNIG